MRSSAPRRQSRLFSFFLLFTYLTFLGGTFYSDANLWLGALHQLILTGLLGYWLVGRIRQRDFPFTALDAPLVVFVAVRWLSSLTALDPRVSLEVAWRAIIHLILFYWLVWQFRKHGWVRLLRAYYLASGVVVIVGLLEFLGWYIGIPFLPTFQVGWLGIGGLLDPVPPVAWRLNFTLSNATSLSAFLALVIPPAMAMGLTARRRDNRLGWYLWIVLAFLVQLLTQSRGGMVALAVSVPIFATGYASRKADHPEWLKLLDRRWLWIGTGILVGILLVASAHLVPEFLARTGSIDKRLEMWRCAVEMIVERPVLGVGTGMYGRTLRHCLDVYTGGYERFTTAHNLFLNLAAESGVMAVGALLWLAVALVRRMRRAWLTASDSRDRLLILGSGAALAGYGVNCLVDTLPATPLVLPVLILAAYLTCGTDVKTRPPVRPGHRAALVASIALGVLIIYALGLLWVDLAQWHFEVALTKVDQGDLTGALDEVEKARAMDPAMELYSFQRAYTLGLLAAGNPDQYLWDAVTAYEAILELDDTYSLHQGNAAALLDQAGEAESALLVMMRAVGTNPPDPSLWINLGQMLEQYGRQDEAVSAYGKSLELSPSLAGAAFWLSSDFRSTRWSDIVQAAVEGGARESVLRLAAGEVELAIQEASSEIARAEDDYLTYQILSQALTEEGDLLNAHTAGKEAIRLCPSCPVPYQLLAEIEWRLGNVEAAERDARTALFISPYGGAQARYTLAQAALADGDYEKARDQLAAAVPPQFLSQNWEVVLYNRRASFQKLPQLTRASPGARYFEPWLELAELYLERGERTEAANVYRTILERDPSLESVQQLLNYTQIEDE